MEYWMSNRDVTLQWDDTNVIEKGHRVYRSNAPMDIYDMPAPIGTIEKNVTKFIDIDQTIGDTNYYRIGAYIDGYEEFSDELVYEIEDYPHQFVLLDNSTATLYTYALDGTYTTLTTLDQQLNNSADVVVDDEFNFYVSKGSTAEIFKINLDGVIIELE